MQTFPTLSLDGTWSFTTDPQERGEREAWYERTSGFGREVEVPSAWQLYGRDLLDYAGSSWYHRDCEVPEEWTGKRIRLHVEAADYLTRAWVNGVLVGEHEGGYTPFDFDVTAHVRPGESNHVVLRVYDPRDNSEIPHGEQGRAFTRVSGIWQGLWLEARPEVFVTAIVPQPHLNPDRFDVTVSLNTAEPGQLVKLALLDHVGHVLTHQQVESTAEGARFSVEIPNARRWSPDDPYLYTLAASVGDGATHDGISVATGLRTFSAIDGRLYLNGAPFVMRGAVCQGYWPETLFSPPSDEEIQREIRLAKEAGINLIRKHGKIEHPRYLDWCDRLGMLVWAEAPACARWTPQAGRRFQRQLVDMVARDAFRPSIIAWSIYYEGRGLESAGEERNRWLRLLHDEIAALDPTRPICTNAGGSSMRTDLLDEHRQYALPEMAREWQIAIEGDVPAFGSPRLVSNFGHWGLPVLEVAPDEERWWLSAAWPAHADEAKWPRTAEANFERYKLQAVFEDLDNLSRLTQRRLTRGVKALIEQLRRRPAFAGYVGRAFSDTEWEADGWLTYDRKPKLGFDEWASFNGPIVVFADLPRHNFWCGETVEATVYVSNHSRNPVTGTVQWGIDGADCDGELNVEIRPFTTEAVGKLSFEAPAFARAQATKLSMRLMSGGWEINTNKEELTFTPRSVAESSGRVAVAHMPGEFVARLREQGFELLERWEPGVTLLAGSLELDVREALERGAHVVFLAEAGAAMAATGTLSFRPLPQGDSWARAASVHYVQWDLFPQLPLNTIMGWEMEDLFPAHVIPLGAYGEGDRRVTSNQADEDPANVLAGYFEGWLGNFAASMLVQSYARGRVLTTTLKLGSQYGHQPIATLLLNRLLTESHLFDLRTVYQLET